MTDPSPSPTPKSFALSAFCEDLAKAATVTSTTEGRDGYTVLFKLSRVEAVLQQHGLWPKAPK